MFQEANELNNTYNDNNFTEYHSKSKQTWNTSMYNIYTWFSGSLVLKVRGLLSGLDTSVLD